MNDSEAIAPTAGPLPQHPVLPARLCALPLDRLPLPPALAAALRDRGMLVLADVLALPAAAFAPGAFPGEHGAEQLRAALAAAFDATLQQLSAPADPATADWPALLRTLLGPLGERDRDLLRRTIGLTVPAQSLPEQARTLGVPLAAVTSAAEQLRERLGEHCRPLLLQLRREIDRELAAFDGVVDPGLVTRGSMLHTLARGADDPQLALRLAAFCFPRDVHRQGNALAGLPPRRFHQLLRRLRRTVTPGRLPLAVDTLLAELAENRLASPRGLVVHLLRHDLHLSIELDADRGEVIVPDPRSPTARLADLLAEVGQPMPFEELAFAYRERFRRATRSRIGNRLRTSPLFVMLGPDLWALRSRHAAELEAVAPLVDKVARRLCAEGGKQNVEQMLADDHPDERTLWLVLDRLAHDPRVRLLGRGEACPATHRRSQVLEQLLLAFRRAAGDVVQSLFVDNQPPARQRLVRRLLRENRLFVMPSEDRIDTLSNYPFNDVRLRQLLALVGKQLDARAGYAQVAALKAIVDRTDLGGTWLTPMLLGDLLRRHGPFELLPAGIVARRELGLSPALLRAARQALRDAGVPLTVDEVLRARPDLCEFTDSMRELLAADPLVQTRDGVHFALV